MSKGRSSTKGGPKPPSQRQRRVNEEIRHALAWTLERGGLRDPVLATTPVTLTEVRTSPDLRNATVFVTPLGGAGDMDAVLDALRRAQGFLRHELSQKVEMRHVPRLSFEPDMSFDEFKRINDLLHRPDVRRDIESPEGEDDEWDDEEEWDEAGEAEGRDLDDEDDDQEQDDLDQDDFGQDGEDRRNGA